jgi:hypothetical protein
VKRSLDEGGDNNKMQDGGREEKRVKGREGEREVGGGERRRRGRERDRQREITGVDCGWLDLLAWLYFSQAFNSTATFRLPAPLLMIAVLQVSTRIKIPRASQSRCHSAAMRQRRRDSKQK